MPVIIPNHLEIIPRESPKKYCNYHNVKGVLKFFASHIKKDFADLIFYSTHQ